MQIVTGGGAEDFKNDRTAPPSKPANQSTVVRVCWDTFGLHFRTNASDTNIFNTATKVHVYQDIFIIFQIRPSIAVLAVQPDLIHSVLSIFPVSDYANCLSSQCNDPTFRYNSHSRCTHYQCSCRVHCVASRCVACPVLATSWRSLWHPSLRSLTRQLGTSSSTRHPLGLCGGCLGIILSTGTLGSIAVGTLAIWAARKSSQLLRAVSALSSLLI